ncbi:MAG: hypothetical protein HZC28_11955 [Spirochaetes bacterium]|nr:hypothetical protein [Spirochaetota bacterium]
MSQRGLKNKLLLLFIDGIGLGSDDPAVNPLVADPDPLFSGLMDGTRLTSTRCVRRFTNGALVPVDANLGVPGLPQSATGQTAIFTGVNAAKIIGRHLHAFPSNRLVALIKEKSLMKALKDREVSVTGANMYSKEFFEKRRLMKRNMFPVSTLTIQASGEACRDIKDYPRIPAVNMDLTNTVIRSRGYDIPIITPEDAAVNCGRIIDSYDFVFFEYFLTDVFGHKKHAGKLTQCVSDLNRFAAALWNMRQASIVIVSDHGNAEDIRTPSHTRNKVPLIILSRDKKVIRRFCRVRTLTDIYSAVLDFYR